MRYFSTPPSCLHPSWKPSLDGFLKRERLTHPSRFLPRFPSKFLLNIVEIRAWNSKSLVRSTNFTRPTNSRVSPSHPPFHHSPSFVRSCSNAIFHLSLRCKSCFARKFLLLQLNSRTLVIYVNKNMVPFREGRNILSSLLGEAEKKERENRCFRHDSREFVRAEKLEHAIYGRSSSLINRTGTKQFFIRPCFRGGLIITEETKLLDVSNKYELALYNA